MADIKATQEEIDTWTKYRNAVEVGSDDWNVYQSNIDFAQSRQTDAIKKLSENEDQLIINLGGYADVIGDLETYLDSGDPNDEDPLRHPGHLQREREDYRGPVPECRSALRQNTGSYHTDLTSCTVAVCRGRK